MESCYANVRQASGGQLKIIQKIITLTVFAFFASIIFKEPLTWRYVGAFACIVGAAAFCSSGAHSGPAISAADARDPRSEIS